MQKLPGHVQKLAFPTGRDSATFRDKGTEDRSLSRDKGTSGQAQNLATGRDGMGRDFDSLSRPVLGRPAGQTLSILHVNGRKKI